MNKADPNDVVDAFTTATTSSRADWATINGLLATEPIRLRRRVAADAFLSLAVSWETFISAWLVAAVNKNATQAVATLSTRLQDHAVTALRLPPSHVATTLITQSHFNLTSVRQVLDPDDYNIVLREHKELKKYADSWLSPPYHGVLAGVTAFQFKPALVTRLVRNALAHQSDAALKAANDETARSTVPVALRRTGPRRLSADGWRAYLLAPHHGQPRIEILHDELIKLADQLVVP